MSRQANPIRSSPDVTSGGIRLRWITSHGVKLLLVMIIVGVAILIGYHLTRQREEVRPPLMMEEGLYRLGDIIVDTNKGEIRFDAAEVRKREGWVQHLIYLHGYKWLKEESAIISDAKLSDLQKAIALLDWRLWDELWYEKTEDRGQRTPIPSAFGGATGQAEDRKLLLSVKWGEEEIAAQELVLTQDLLEIGDFIFLGSPYFDHIALEAPPGVDCRLCPVFLDCRLCPVFPLEERALRELFIRESGQSGYELNSALFPAEGTKVTIIIRITDYTQR